MVKYLMKRFEKVLRFLPYLLLSLGTKIWILCLKFFLSEKSFILERTISPFF